MDSSLVGKNFCETVNYLLLAGVIDSLTVATLLNQPWQRRCHTSLLLKLDKKDGFFEVVRTWSWPWSVLCRGDSHGTGGRGELREYAYQRYVTRLAGSGRGSDGGSGLSCAAHVWILKLLCKAILEVSDNISSKPFRNVAGMF